MLKTSENPPIIWPEGYSVRQFEGCWWVAHTKARNEKAMAWDLLRKNVPYFLPMTWKVSRNKGRIIRSLLPLFPGYLFFCGNQTHRLEALKTNRAANIIPVVDAEKLVSELSAIETVIKAGKILLPHDFIKVGQRCRVIAGPLMGIEGIVTQTSGQMRLVLQVEMLGQAACVEIDRDLIEKVENP